MRIIRSKKVGMKRAKKKKPAIVEAPSETASSAGIEEQPAPSPAKAAEKPRQPPSPGRALRLEAGGELRTAVKLRKYAQRQQTNAEKKWRAELAIHDAKLATLAKVKMVGSAVERVKAADRVLKGTNDADRRLLQAAVAVHEAQLDAATCMIAELQSQNTLHELQIARFKRMQRRRRAPRA